MTLDGNKDCELLGLGMCDLGDDEWSELVPIGEDADIAGAVGLQLLV